VLALFLPSGCSRHGTADKKITTVPADSGKENAVVSPATPPAAPSPPAVPGNVTIDGADGVIGGAMVSPWQLGLGRLDGVATAPSTTPEPAAAESQSPKNVTVDSADGVTANAMAAPSQELGGASGSSLSVLVQDGSAFIGAALESNDALADSTAAVPLMVAIEHAASVVGWGMVKQGDLEGRAGSVAPMVLVEHASGALGSPMGAEPTPG
jgi:hypothetical protein